MSKKTDIDLERVISDPAYRRRVIKQLNAEAPAQPTAEDSDPPPARRPSKPESK
ncbi:MAG: hypothetical protein QNJ94_08805 [Alphaproteobacteria bacterium]|nr:hypothetical protein [Alphaproteobacteria bacterium]